MGYSANSPVKKIWIPLEYDWLQEYVVGENFSEFNEAYKKKYGIDLTEIVKLDTDYIVIEGDVSTYAIADSTYFVSYVDNKPWNMVSGYESGNSDAISQLLIADERGEYGFGLQFKISKSVDVKYENILVELVQL